MLSTIRTALGSTLRSARTSAFPLGHVLTGAAIAVLSTTLIGPAIADQQKSVQETRALADSTGLHREQLSVYEGLVRDRLEAEAETTLASAKATVAADAEKADASAAKTAIAGLGEYHRIGDSRLRKAIDETKAATGALAAASAEADRQAAAAAARARALANTPDGARSTARSLAASRYGWGDDQFQCLDSLWQKESGWNYQAANGGSGATGIPQALPGSKMAAFGSDWATNATTQILWGLDYVSRSYGTPCSAWSHSEAMNWY